VAGRGAIETQIKMKAKSPTWEHLEDGPEFFLTKKNLLWGFTEGVVNTEEVNTEESFVKGQKELLNQS
jgi:hypothetical protein